MCASNPIKQKRNPRNRIRKFHRSQRAKLSKYRREWKIFFLFFLILLFFKKNVKKFKKLFFSKFQFFINWNLKRTLHSCCTNTDLKPPPDFSMCQLLNEERKKPLLSHLGISVQPASEAEQVLPQAQENFCFFLFLMIFYWKCWKNWKIVFFQKF